MHHGQPAVMAKQTAGHARVAQGCLFACLAFCCCQRGKTVRQGFYDQGIANAAAERKVDQRIHPADMRHALRLAVQLRKLRHALRAEYAGFTGIQHQQQIVAAAVNRLVPVKQGKMMIVIGKIALRVGVKADMAQTAHRRQAYQQAGDKIQPPVTDQVLC